MPAEPSVIPSLAADSGLRAWVRAPWQTLAIVVGSLYWLVGGLLISLIGWPLYFVLPRRLSRRIGGALLGLVFEVFVGYLRATGLVRAELAGLAPLRGREGAFIVAPNHLALWDAVFLLAVLPRAVCVMKRGIIRNPLLGGGATLAGYIPACHNRQMIRAAVDALADGRPLILFPEGTRTRPESRWINPLKGGVALIAMRAQVPVYPVFIRSDSRFMEKGWPPWRRPEFPIRMEFELGTPLDPQPAESPQQFVARLQQVFEEQLSRPHPLRRRSGS